jgi:Rhs element Vgr protein
MSFLGRRNTDLVSFTIKVNGTDIGSEFQVLEIIVDKEVNRIPSARILIRDGDVSEQNFPASDSDTFIPGNEIEIQAGYHSEEDSIFKGIIVRHGIRFDRNRLTVLQIDCKDKAVKLTRGRKSRSFSDSTDSDIIETILGDYDLTKDIESTSLSHESLVQYQATDWDFINLRAESNNKLVYIDDGTITIKAPLTAGVPVGEFSYGTNLLEFEAAMDARDSYPAVKTSTWSIADQETTDAEGTDTGIGSPGNISPDDLASVLGGEDISLKHPGALPVQELQSWADGMLSRSRLAKSIGRISVQGQADIKPGSLITLSGVGDRFNGNAFVTAIRHEISAGTWETRIQSGIPPLTYYEKNKENLGDFSASGIIAPVRGLQIALVTQLQDDPQGEDRVKIKLPMLGADNEDVWARIGSLDAGDSRGFFFRPEIGDEVIVGFLNDDPRYPIILGMLNSSAKPTPSSPSDDNNEKGLVTRSEMKIWFDDDKKSLEISTPAGKKIMLDEDAGEINIEDENGNKVVMNSDGISMESAKDIILKASGDVKVEGTNIQQSANAQFKAEGNAGAELSTSAQAVIKGSVVQIN